MFKIGEFLKLTQVSIRMLVKAGAQTKNGKRKLKTADKDLINSIISTRNNN